MNPRTPDLWDSAAIAGYPTRSLTLPFGAEQLSLLVVRRLEDYVDTDALLRDADAPEPPYWAHLWTGSRALARLVATEIDCAGRRVVEVGCGLGLVGIVAARRGAAATLIDTARAGLAFARANAALNGCVVNVLQTDIRRAGISGPFDLCLAAEVTYEPALQIALADFLAVQLAPNGRAWCAESVRTTDQGFRRACESHGLHVTELEVREPDEPHDVSVRITRVERPA